jgi:hypothetical protein
MRQVKSMVSKSYRLPRTLLGALICLSPLSACTSTPCAQPGGSLKLNKLEVYQMLAADGGVDDGGTDAGFPDDGAAALPCPSSQQVSQYVAIRYQKGMDPSEIQTPVDEGASCEYPVVQTICE